MHAVCHEYFQAAGWQRFTRGKKLGTEYTAERIREWMVRSPKRRLMVRKESELIRQLIDLQNDSRIQKRGDVAHWTQQNHLKQAAKTLIFLMDNNLTFQAELISKSKELSAANAQTSGSIKALRKQYEQITAIKDKLYHEYRNLNQKVRQHETV